MSSPEEYKADRNHIKSSEILISILSDDEVAVVGGTANQVKGMFLRQYPEQEIDVKTSHTKNLKSNEWKNLSGEIISPDKVEKDSTKEIILVKGPMVRKSLARLEDIYKCLRKIDLTTFFIEQ